jgi:imidazolonepropionase
LRAAGVPIAVATDCNPGTSPLLSPLLTMHLACTRLGLTVDEALAGMTTNAARALDLPTDLADLVIWDVASPAQLLYWLGTVPEHTVIFDGAGE